MTEGSDYQKTIAIMCRDFLTQMDDIPGFAQENDLLDRITSVIIDEGDEDLFHIKNLEDHLHKYESRLLSLYSKNPDNSYLDTLYRRSASLREMCTDFTRKVIDTYPEK
ncbi:MAG TPA: hypothetical protein PKG60_02100 [Spirochaetota bacterium]|nr:hypothetical protein [Spirochaetota bacterium]HPS85885.1 hypothetical protein [Spirochaetota bacterium]